ncbi:MAG: DegT/DnrJ/EryC1/StrS family aminotransferase [Candidatus Zixiibacteriota bacterium]|nr:MAG: DegT/DnrJ/EryC1/StrS family aminotransferase [candidate division Zixibacteria bacterium]
MPIPLLDLSRQYAYLKPDLDQAVIKVLSHGGFILGPEVKQLESAVAELCDVKYAAGVASGTDALLLALHACGVVDGDEVITPDLSFFATAGVVSRLGARPVFVDIEPDTYNIDPEKVAAAITSKTRAIVPVHLFGQVADMDPIMEIARHHGIKVVEDAAQAIGARYKDRPAGSIGDYGCFSFYPSKNLGAGGDGGMITTDTDENIDLLRILRVHGGQPKYYHKIIGYNSRLATLQAAVLLVKLAHLQTWSEKRIEHAGIYDEAFRDIDAVVCPVVKDYSTFHIYNQYTIAVENRDRLMAELKKAEIGFEIYYPVPFHMQECFAYLGYEPNDFPVATRAAAQVISLPIYPEMTPSEQAEIIATVERAVS